MRKIQIIILILTLTLLAGCKQTEEIPRENGIDTNTMVVTITSNEEYNIKGSIEYLSENDLSELYLMMFANTHYEGEDRVTVNSMFINEEAVSFSFEGVDSSALHIDLNRDIIEGEVLVIEYDMDVVYPDTFRLAHYGDMIYQMYFYPYVAVYDEGFDIDPYALRGETYYNVLNDYDVTITIDEDFIVAAPGDLIDTDEDGDMVSYRYKLENARDFSFSASTYYEVYEWEVEDMEYEIYSIRELTTSELDETKTYVEQSFDTYQTYIGEFYLDRFILELGYIYGMESSGIIYCSEEISEPTIVHEIVHQWFFYMIGNDSYNDSFLDESLTTYMSALYYYDLYGMEGYNGSLDYRDSSQERLEEAWGLYQGRSMLETTDQMGDGYAFIIYYHGPSLFREYVYTYLDNDVEEFMRIISVYFEEYNGEIASIDGLLSVIEDESGVAGTKDWFLFHINDLQDLSNTPE